MPDSNYETLIDLCEQGELRLARGSLLEHAAEPVMDETSFDRVEGMLLGLAIGDALGAVSEGMAPQHRQNRFGEIRDYLPNPWAEGRRVGTPTDDSQLAFYTLEHMLNSGELEPAQLGRKFVNEPVFGIGGTVSSALRNLESGVPWHQAGPRSAGNGALMRIAPVLVPHLAEGGRALWADTVLAAMLTHNDPASSAACLAFVGILWDLLAMDTPPDSSWWVARYYQIADEFENAADYEPRRPAVRPYRGRICDFVAEHVPAALEQGTNLRQACDRWGSGAYLLETLPSVFLILSRFGSEPEQAIVRAVNDTLDNDTHAAIVGAAVGALHGATALPDRWKDGLLGQLRGGDDGQIQSLVEQSRAKWWTER